MVDIGESVENIWGLGGGKIMSHSWMDGQVNFPIPVNFLLVLLFLWTRGEIPLRQGTVSKVPQQLWWPYYPCNKAKGSMKSWLKLTSRVTFIKRRLIKDIARIQLLWGRLTSRRLIQARSNLFKAGYRKRIKDREWSGKPAAELASGLGNSSSGCMLHLFLFGSKELKGLGNDFYAYL